jgi:hypothetical protein
VIGLLPKDVVAGDEEPKSEPDGVAELFPKSPLVFGASSTGAGGASNFYFFTGEGSSALF